MKLDCRVVDVAFHFSRLRLAFKNLSLQFALAALELITGPSLEMEFPRSSISGPLNGLGKFGGCHLQKLERRSIIVRHGQSAAAKRAIDLHTGPIHINDQFPAAMRAIEN